MTFFSPILMGRVVPATAELPVVAVWAIQLCLSFLYGLVIARVVAGFRFERALMAGALCGLALYGLNLAVVSWLWPGLRGEEFAVVFTHVAFGLIAAAAYRGLLKRRLRVARAP